MSIGRRAVWTVLLIAVLAGVGCTLSGPAPTEPLEDAATPTPQDGPAGTEDLPQIIDVTPLGGVPDLPSETPEATPEPIGEPTEAPVVGAQSVDDATPEPVNTAKPGDVLFVREGQVWAVDVTTFDETPLTSLPEGSIIRDLTVSPDGLYAAFVADGVRLMLLDVLNGGTTIIDDTSPDVISRPVWTPDSSLLYYQKTTTNPENIPEAEADGLWHVIYEVALNPVSLPAPMTAVPESEGSAVALLAAFGERRLLLNEYPPGSETASRLLVFDSGLLPLTAEGFDTISVLNVSPDGMHILFVDQSGWAESGADAPVPLYVGELSLGDELVNVQPIALEPTRAYLAGRFGPEGQRIAALYADVPLGEGSSTHMVLLTPNGEDPYTQLEVGVPPGSAYSSLRWYGDTGVVAQRAPSGEEPSEVWLIPLDGTEGTLLAVGEQPAVVSSGPQG